ncbi:MAG TPA: EamA family transporter, partial [Thermoanaerobaculia bacterium]|nr:EamA family transporter [Thermoanaerobaculia bacterium]
MKHQKAWAWAAFAVVCVVWGTTYLGIRIALETVPPLLLTGIRFTAAGLIMLAIAKLRGDAIPRDFR